MDKVGDGTMPRNYDNIFAKCPFFLTSGKSNIWCEGITNDCSLCIKFVSEQKKKQHRRIFCDAKYQNCELFKTLEKKYED